MNNLRFPSKNRRTRKVACTVSAAALMLGVSQAATVGLHFQDSYCYDARYTGFPVTLPAFGVGTNGWQNLTPMLTGYGCTNNSAPYTLNQVINTGTSTGGLHPLPNGSLSVSWTAYTANFSGFGGYAVNTATHGYGGPLPDPAPSGEAQIYASFLRDGVNFGPGSSGGDNNQTGYSVDITGLKSLFTNSPFVIQLVAGSDSMLTLTNAFVIDATLSSTQSVTYPSTPIPSNEGGTGGWLRGHGGGLSTVSASLNTDHVKIIGNRAAHGTDGGPLGFNAASTISGFIVTDKPVVTMSARSVLASAGDAISLNPYAIGVAPLHYQWRKAGIPIAGATLSNYNVASAGAVDNGSYDLVVTNAYGSATSAVSSVTIDRIAISNGKYLLDSKPFGPEEDGQNFGATWQASSLDALGTNRTGLMSFNGLITNQIVVPAGTNLNSAIGTIMFWMRSAILPAVSATLFDRRSGVGVNGGHGLLITQAPDGAVSVDVDHFANLFVSTRTTSDDLWHHVAVVYDQSETGQISIYIDGVLDSSSGNFTAWAWQPTQQIELGLSHDPNLQPFDGKLDDVRVYNRALTDVEIASIHTSSSLVDTTALQLRLNFDAVPTAGLTLNWQGSNVVLQSADDVAGPYVDLPFSASPYVVATQKTKKFYRYRHTPVSLTSNPYLM